MSDTPTANAVDPQDQGKPMDTRVALRRLMKLIYKEQVERRKEIEALNEQAERRTRITKWVIIAMVILTLIVGSHVGSIIYSMNDDMDDMAEYMMHMRKYMKHMDKNMKHMRSSMHTMETAMVPMANSVGVMSGDVASMNGNFGAVRNNMQEITDTMRMMQYDTSVMRVGVTGMSRDTHEMGEPFRSMNDVIPW